MGKRVPEETESCCPPSPGRWRETVTATAPASAPRSGHSRASPLIRGLFPPHRHADGIFNKAYRKLLGQLSARKYLHSLMAKRVG